MVDIRYLGVRAGSGASIATLRLASSAIAKAHEWAGHESPCRDQGVCASLKGWGRRLAKPQRQAGALTADVLAVIRLTAVQPRKRGRGHETEEQAPQRGKFDVALVAVLSDAGLRRSEAAALTWGDVQRWDDGSGRITVIRSKTDVEAAGAVVAVIPAAMKALDAIRPEGVGSEVKVFALSESQIARRVKVIAKPAGLADWKLFSGHSGWAWPAAWPRTALPPTRSNARAAGKKTAAWSAATPAASPPGRRCGICNSSKNGKSGPLSPRVLVNSWRPWRTCWSCTPNSMTQTVRWSASTRPPPNCGRRCARRCPSSRDGCGVRTMSIAELAPAISSWRASHQGNRVLSEEDFE